MHFIDETAPNGRYKQAEIFVQRGKDIQKMPLSQNRPKRR